MGEDECGRTRVEEGVVWAIVDHPVALGDIGEAVRQCATRVELARQPKRAQRGDRLERRARPTRRTLDEGPIEIDVVGGEHCAVETPPEVGEHLTLVRRTSQVGPADAMDATGANPLQRPSQPDE